MIRATWHAVQQAHSRLGLPDSPDALSAAVVHAAADSRNVYHPPRVPGRQAEVWVELDGPAGPGTAVLVVLGTGQAREYSVVTVRSALHVAQGARARRTHTHHPFAALADITLESTS
jgi:hypothetical protein